MMREQDGQKEGQGTRLKRQPEHEGQAWNMEDTLLAAQKLIFYQIRSKFLGMANSN